MTRFGVSMVDSVVQAVLFEEWALAMGNIRDPDDRIEGTWTSGIRDFGWRASGGRMKYHGRFVNFICVPESPI